MSAKLCEEANMNVIGVVSSNVRASLERLWSGQGVRFLWRWVVGRHVR